MWGGLGLLQIGITIVTVDLMSRTQASVFILHDYA